MSKAVLIKAAAELELRRRDRLRWQTDPVAFARERLRFDPTDDQAAVLLSVLSNRRTFAKAGNGVGKTTVASVVVCWWLECFEGSQVITSAPTYKQVADLLWKEVRIRHAEAAPPLRGKVLPKEPRWDISHDHFAVGKTAQDEEGFKGSHSTGGLLIVLDEGPGCPPWMYAAANTMMTGAADRLLTIGNPTVTSGPFHDAFHSAASLNSLLTLSVRTHPNIEAQLAAIGLNWEEYRETPPGVLRLPDDLPVPVPGAVTLYKVEDDKVTLGVGSPGWAAVVEGDFPSAGDRALIDLGWLDRARIGAAPSPAAALPSRLSLPQGKWAGLDVARFGSDRSVLVLMDGQRVDRVEAWKGAELSHTAGRALQVIRAGYTLNFDEGGLGAAITSHLKEHGVKIGAEAHPINAGERAKDPDHFPKMRDQLWCDAADLLRAGVVDLSPLDEHSYRLLLGELTAVQYELDSAGRRKVESKDQMRKRAGRSPDVADAFNLCLYRPVRWKLRVA